MFSIHDIKPDIKKAIFLAKKALPELVCDAVNLEGINYTLPEVQTLLQGVSVGGHKLSDQMITLNQANAWKFLFKLIEDNQFRCDKATVLAIHAIAAEEEALSWGVFRTGQVTIAGSQYQPPFANQLDQLWREMTEHLAQIESIFERAIYCFLQMARTQFFYDVNKRMGRFMMNGILLSHGFPAINVPAKTQVQFNELMLDFYMTNDGNKMHAFLIECYPQAVLAIMAE